MNTRTWVAALLLVVHGGDAVAASFSTGKRCASPDAFSWGERLLLGRMVGHAAKVEEHWNVAVLGMRKVDYRKGKRWLRVEFDCPSLGALRPKDGDRKTQLEALLSTDARAAVMTGHRRYDKAFKQNVDVLVIASRPGLSENEVVASLKNKRLRIERTNFTSGGWTDADWKDWLGANLAAAEKISDQKFASGRSCQRPKGFILAEWQALQGEVKVAVESEERWNVAYLGLPKKRFKAGERIVQIEFDCPSLEYLVPGRDADNRESQIRALLSRDARGAVQTAGRRFKSKFAAKVQTVVIGSHAHGDPKETRVTLRNGVLRISRTNFVSGGMTDYDWRQWLERNL